MKRFISLVLVAVFLVISLAPDAAASEVNDDTMFNVLDFASANNSGENYVRAGSGSYTATAVYDPINGLSMRYIDMLVVSVSGDLASATCNGTALTVLQVGSRLFRVYGSFTTALTLSFVFTSATANVKYTILELQASAIGAGVYPETGYLTYNGAESHMADSSSSARFYLQTSLESEGFHNFTFNAFLNNFHKYDSYDVFFTVNCNSINSIRVYQEDLALPFEVNYLASVGSDGEIEILDPNGVSVVRGHDVTYYVILRIDMTNADRTSIYLPYITFSGTYDASSSSSYVYLTKVTGRILFEGASPAYFYFSTMLRSLNGWFSDTASAIVSSIDSLKSSVLDGLDSINTKFDSLLSFINPDTSSSDEFVSGVSGAADNLDSLSDSLDDYVVHEFYVTPDWFSYDIASAGSLLSSIFTEVSNTSWLYTLISAALIISLFAYFLYGKV